MASGTRADTGTRNVSEQRLYILSSPVRASCGRAERWLSIDGFDSYAGDFEDMIGASYYGGDLFVSQRATLIGATVMMMKTLHAIGLLYATAEMIPTVVSALSRLSCQLSAKYGISDNFIDQMLTSANATTQLSNLSSLFFCLLSSSEAPAVHDSGARPCQRIAQRCYTVPYSARQC
jgi:hypothetical protein